MCPDRGPSVLLPFRDHARTSIHRLPCDKESTHNITKQINLAVHGYAVVVQGMADMLTCNCYHVTVANCMSFAQELPVCKLTLLLYCALRTNSTPALLDQRDQLLTSC